MLDTHVWLWSLLQPDELVERVARALEDGANELWLSPISVWEAWILIEKGRLSVGTDADTWLDAALLQSPLKQAALTQEVARETGRVKLPHRDPADRFLVATARVFDLTLVTADKRLLRAKACAVMASR